MVVGRVILLFVELLFRLLGSYVDRGQVSCY